VLSFVRRSAWGKTYPQVFHSVSTAFAHFVRQFEAFNARNPALAKAQEAHYLVVSPAANPYMLGFRRIPANYVAEM
jgi:hypothetical protein